MTLLYQLWAYLRRDYLLASASRLAFLWQVASVVFAAPTLYFLGRLIQPGASPHLAAFGGDYFAFVILGVALLGFLSAGMGAAAGAVRHEQLVGTLETLLVTPTPLPTLGVGASLWAVLTATGQAVLYLLLGVRIFGMDVTGMNLLSVLVILLLAAAAYASLGIFSAAFVLFFKYPDPLTSIFAGVSAFLAGVFYPTSVLPPALQQVAQVVPLTHALRALRLAVLQGYGVTALRREILFLALFSAVAIPLAVGAFRVAIVHARRSGTLGAY